MATLALNFDNYTSAFPLEKHRVSHAAEVFYVRFPFYRAILLEGEFNSWLSRGVHWQSIPRPGVQVQPLLTQMQSCAFQYLRLLDNGIQFYIYELNL